MNDLKGRRVRSAAILFLGIACLGAGYLLVVSLKDGPVAGCGKGSSCSDVLKSRWAYFLPGVPVSAPALLTYLVLLYGLVFRPKGKAWGVVLLVGGLMVFGAAIWFVGIQALLLKTFCKYCMATHLVGATGAACTLAWMRPVARELVPVGVATAALGLATLAACQYFFPQKTTLLTQLEANETLSEEAQKEPSKGPTGKVVPIGDLKLNLDLVPYKGNPDSEKRMLLLFDYTCSTCRRVHTYLEQAEARFGKDNFLLVMLPTPLNRDCNRFFDSPDSKHRNACLFASMALAIWYTDREKFAEYDRWMIETGTFFVPPEAAAARAKAEELLGKDLLAKALTDPRITQQIEAASSLWNTLKNRSGKWAMPKMVFAREAGKTSVAEGAPETEAGIFEILESQLGLQPLK